MMLAAAVGFSLAVPTRAGGDLGTIERIDRPVSLPNTRIAEHRYRVVGRVRLVFFWSGSKEVGAARMTWHGHGADRTVALLIGSDPQRAPSRMNEWAYLREEVHAGGADAFEVRSLTTAGFNPEPKIRLGGPGHMFGVVCSSVGQGSAHSWVTNVPGDEVSYHQIDRLLDRAAEARRWESLQTATPAGVEAGFLTALERLLWTSLDDDGAPDVGRGAPLAYVYKGVVYDLSLRKRSRVARRVVRGQVYDRLARADFSIRNRKTGDISKFAVTYQTEGPSAGRPVQISFQPNWWLSVELHLDEGADVPADPATDPARLARIRSICAAASRAATTNSDDRGGR